MRRSQSSDISAANSFRGVQLMKSNSEAILQPARQASKKTRPERLSPFNSDDDDEEDEEEDEYHNQVEVCERSIF